MPVARTRTATAALALAALSALSIPAAHAGGAPRAAARTVSPGDSVQAALDAAAPGDTVLLLPGTHVGGVEIRTPRVTLRGSGPDTVLVPGTGGRCAGGDGVCLSGTETAPLAGVTIADLTARGFSGAGIHGVRTSGLTVTGTVTRANGTHGVSIEWGTGSRVAGNVADDHPQAGVFIAEDDAAGTVLTGNTLTGNRTGVNVRRARHLTVEANHFTGNCAGLFVVGDETVPRAGVLTVRQNVFRENNKYCAATPRLAHIQGSGIVLTGATEVTVTGNLVTGNRGDSPMSGGVVLAPTMVGAGNTGHVVTGNVLLGNLPADIVVRDPAAAGNTLTGNLCGSSIPPGLC